MRAAGPHDQHLASNHHLPRIHSPAMASDRRPRVRHSLAFGERTHQPNKENATAPLVAPSTAAPASGALAYSTSSTATAPDASHKDKRPKRARQSLPLPPPARRVLAPRKSALKPTQQVFASPTGLAPDPINAPFPQHQRAHTSAIPTAVAEAATAAASASASGLASGSGAGAGGAMRSRPSSFASSALGPDASGPLAPPPAKKRRVTFSRVQEKTDYGVDEPTMSIRPASEHPPPPAGVPHSPLPHRHHASDSDGSGSASDSDSDSDSDPDVVEYHAARRASRRSSTARTGGTGLSAIPGGLGTPVAPRDGTMEMDLTTGSMEMDISSFNPFAGTESERSMSITRIHTADSQNESTTFDVFGPAAALAAQAQAPRPSVGGGSMDMDLDSLDSQDSSADADTSATQDDTRWPISQRPDTDGDRTQTMAMTRVFTAAARPSVGGRTQTMQLTRVHNGVTDQSESMSMSMSTSMPGSDATDESEQAVDDLTQTQDASGMNLTRVFRGDETRFTDGARSVSASASASDSDSDSHDSRSGTAAGDRTQTMQMTKVFRAAGDPGAQEDRTQTMQMTGVFDVPAGEEEDGSTSTTTATAHDGVDDEAPSYHTASTASSGEQSMSGSLSVEADERGAADGDGEQTMDFTTPLAPIGLSRIEEEDTADMLTSSLDQSSHMPANAPLNSLPHPQARASITGFPLSRTTIASPPHRRFSALPAPAPAATSPSRFRDQLFHGHASPGYRHSPARRVPAGQAQEPASDSDDTDDVPKRALQHSPPPRAHAHAHAEAEAETDAGAHPPPEAEASTSSSALSTSASVSRDDAQGPGPRVTLQGFLETMGLHFQDGFTAMRPHVTRPENTPASLGGKEDVLRWVRAAAGVAPMLSAHAASCAQLAEHVAQAAQDLERAEAQFDAHPPAWAAELVAYPPEREREQRAVAAQLKVQKSAARAFARHTYYGWRRDNEFDPSLLAELQANRARLTTDHHSVTTLSASFHRLLPLLRARHQKLRSTLALEREHAKAVEACDPRDLENIHEAIEEQATALQQFRDERREAADGYARVAERLAAAVEREKVADAAIAAAQAERAQIKGFTKSEAARLLKELHALESLHGWSLRSVETDGSKQGPPRLTFCLHPNIEVTVTLSPGAEIESVHLKCLPVPSATGPHSVWKTSVLASSTDKHHDIDLDTLLVSALNDEWATVPPGTRVPSLVRSLTASFVALRHLQAEIASINLHFPITVRRHMAPSATTPAPTPGASGRRRRSRASLAPLPKDHVFGVHLMVPLVLPRTHAKWVVSLTCPLTHLVRPGTAQEDGLFSPALISARHVYGPPADAQHVALTIAQSVQAHTGLHSVADALLETVRSVDA